MVNIDITVSIGYTIFTGSTSKIKCAFSICHFGFNIVF